MASASPPATLQDYPCDYLFKVFGPNRDGFRDAVLQAVGTILPVPRDAVKCRPSSAGAHQCVTVLVRLVNEEQRQTIYTALQKVPDVSYLL